MATDPMYSDYLQFNPNFRWGGRSWGAGDKAAFEKYLRRRGVSPARWYRNHRVAAKSFDPMEQRIYGMFQPQLTALDAERKRVADAYNRRAQNLTGFSAALQPFLAQIPGMIQTPYREGAAGVQSLGAGLGGSLNADTAAEAAGMNAVLGTLGAPEGQNVAAGDGGAILAGVGGMEGDLMRATGGGYAAAAAQLPKTAALSQTIAMKDLLREAAEADAGFSSDVKGILQGMPEARSQIRQQMLEEKQKKEDMRLDRLKFKADQHYKQYLIWKGQQELLLSQGRLKEAQKAGRRADEQLKLAQATSDRLAMGSAGRDVWGNPKPGLIEAPNGQVYDPSKQRWDPKKGRLVPKNSAGKPTEGNTWGPSKRSSMSSDLRVWVNQHKKDGFAYQDAFNYLYQKYLGYAGHGITQDKLREVVKAVLHAGGVKPGPNGAGGGSGKPPGYQD